jgi:hypothetical protein
LLSVSGYTGNCADSWAVHNGWGFSTFDNDNDERGSEIVPLNTIELGGTELVMHVIQKGYIWEVLTQNTKVSFGQRGKNIRLNVAL